MEGTHAHHCFIQEGGSSCCALEVDVVEASSPTSPAPSLQCEERGHVHHPEADTAPQLADYNLVGNGGDWQQSQGTSPCHHSLNSHIEGATGPPHLPSSRSHMHQKRQGSSQCSSKSPSNLHSPPHDESWLSLPPCTLDPNAREFTPPLLPSLQITFHMPLNMQPVYTAHSGIGVSHVCYQTSTVAAMQGPCNYDQLVDTTLRIGPTPEEIVTANSSREVSTHVLHNMEPGPSTLAVSSAEDDMSTVRQHMNGSSCSYAAAELKASHLGNVGGFLTPLHERSSVPVYNPPILTNPYVGILPPMAMPFPPPPPPPPMPPYPNPVTSTHPLQALNTVYTHKHFHPQFGWKEHISRALLISGIPPHLTESQLRVQLEQWGDIRALYTDKLPQGILSVQFFDLRASRQALRDMQNQHLLRQQRFQEHLYAQSGMRFQNYSLQSGAAEQGLSYKGLLGGYVVWAQYIAAWSVPVPDAHNQGTLVLFNVGADVSLERLQEVFEKYGYVRELREAPTKRQHKFVEFYDTRDAEAAWAALNGQEVCGKCVKIEFSRQGGPVRKQKSGPVLVHHDLVASGREVSSKVDSAFCAWQSHSTHGYYHQEWQARFYEGNPPPLPRSEMIMLPSTLTGPDDCLSYGSSMSSESGKIYVKHIQGAISGPRRKHCTVRPLHPRVSDVLAHGKVNTLVSLRPAETLRRNVSTRGHPHFEYNEREVYLMSGEPRTTLMIKNIPNKYSQQMLLSLLDHHCGENNSQIVDMNEPESAYDFVYLPIDFKNRCNLGYAFVNFTSALATLKFYKAFHLQAWEEFNSRKVCDIKYARVQGRHALENHFCSSRFACDTPDYLPVVFTPPRNGLQCPPPRVAAGLMMMKSGRPALAGISISSTEQILKPPIQSLQKSEPRPRCDSTTTKVDDETKLLDFNGEPQADGAK